MIIDQQSAKGFYQADMYGLGPVWSWVSGEGAAPVIVAGPFFVKASQYFNAGSKSAQDHNAGSVSGQHA